MTVARRDRLKQQLREEILAAARELFVKEGYASVSMRKIADEVGVAPGTLYLHFHDKKAILGAICIETFSKLDKRLEAILSDRSDPLERIRRAGRLYIQFGLDHPDHYFITFGLLEKDKQQEESLTAGLQSFDCLRRNVREAIEGGLIRSGDVEEVAQSLWAAMHGVVMLLIVKKGFPFIEQSRLIDSVLDITIEGIKKR